MEATIGRIAAGKPSFGQIHFGAAQLGDARLTRRAVITADALGRYPGGTLPQKLPKAELLGFYDFANNGKVHHDNLLAGHVRHTRDQMNAGGRVKLIIHDTTEADYSGLDVAGLGPIGNGGCRGLLLHNVLAMDFETHEVLGLLGQMVHQRRQVKKKEGAKAKREHPQRESRLWLKGVEAVGPTPAGAVWVNLMDRGGDTFESLQRQQDLGQKYVVRSKSNRRIEVKDGRGRMIHRKLHHWARRLENLGERSLSVQANQAQPARQCRVRVAAGPVKLLPPPHPRRGEYRDELLAMWVVHVWEIDPPAGVEALEWILLTNVATATQPQAWERVEWYECRPVIEEFHKAQKTGCGMELLQFTTRKALEVSIAMLSVVAVQLLRLRDLSRQEQAAGRPASGIVDVQYVEVLSLWRYKQVRPLSVQDFFHALARLGGHLNRRHDRPPGWLVLWRGWMELQRLVEGAQLQRLRRRG